MMNRLTSARTGIALVVLRAALVTTGVEAGNPKCISEPYADDNKFERGLGRTVECFREKLGDPGTDGATDGVWYSTETNDRMTLQSNSAVAWGFKDDPEPPSIVARPTTKDQVKDALSCSVKNGMRVIPWGKGHNWEGLTALPNYVLIRLDAMCDVSVNSNADTMTIDAGCAVGHQVGKLSLFGETKKDDRLLLNFGCPNIGIGGSFAGGGQGYFSGYLGMQIDAAKKIHVLLYDAKEGNVEEVVAEGTGEYSELFWAMRGGMGGYGIITKVELQTVESPSPDAVTWIDLYYNKQSRGTAQYLFQQLVLNDSRFGIAQSNRFDTGGSQVRVSYLGSATEAITKLIEAGMIDDALLDTEGTYALTPEYSTVLLNYERECLGSSCAKKKFRLPKRGVSVFQFPSFREFTAMAWFNPVLINLENACDPVKYGLDCGPENGAGIAGQYFFISRRKNALTILDMAEDASSDLLEPTSSFWKPLPSTLFQSPGLQWRLTEEGWEALAGLRDSSDAEGCKYTLLFTHATGGAAASVPQSDTAYPWRGYPLLNFLLGNTDTEECRPFLALVNEVRENYAVDGYSGGGAYINYPGNPNNCCNGGNAESGLSWEQLYYGDNYNRLQKARNTYDPLNIYSKLQLPEPEDECSGRAGLRG